MCFREILGVNQDLSPQGVLVRQFPSAAQQAGASAVTQPCLSPTFRCLSLPFLVFFTALARPCSGPGELPTVRRAARVAAVGRRQDRRHRPARRHDALPASERDHGWG